MNSVYYYYERTIRDAILFAFAYRGVTLYIDFIYLYPPDPDTTYISLSSGYP